MPNEQPKQEKPSGRFEILSKPLRFLFYVFSAIGIFTSVGYIFGFLPLLDISYYFILMAMFLPMIFLLLPAYKKEKKVAWWSYVLAIVTFGLTIFMSTKGYALIYQTWIPANTWQITVAVILTILLLEAARRAGGMIFLVLILFFSLYPSIADKMPGMFWGPPSPLSRTIAFNIYSNDALLGIVTRVVGETLIGFLILAALLLATGAADFFLKLAMAIMGGVRGGAAKVAVVASGFFGSLSGSIFGNVVGTGSVTIPTMKRSGFRSYYAGALEACASTGGMMMPPVMGAVAFIMADFTSTEYGTIVIAAAIPSCLYYFGLFCHVDSYAAKNGLKGLEEREVPSLKELIKEGWPFFIVLLFLIWGLLYMRWERLAPFYASAVLVILSPFNKNLKMNFKKVKEVLLETAKLLSQTIALLLPTSFILGGIMGTGVAPVISAELVRLGGDSVFLVLAVGVGICIIFGMMGMIVAAYLMLALTFAPSLEQLAGLNMLAIHLFIAYYALLAAITPPIALASFIASRISQSSPMLTSFHSARLGIVLFILPFFFLFEPSLIFQGPLYKTAIWTTLNVVAILLIAGGSEGYMYKFGHVRNWARPLLFIGGILVGLPEWKSTVVGLGLAVVVFALPKFSRAKRPEASFESIPEGGEQVA
jgi:TRAP transporter 4TM/12TM fusion protein